MTAVDRVTFEVIRHRLWAINDDQGRMASRLFPAAEFADHGINSVLTTADGRGLYAGVHVPDHGSTLDAFVRRVLEAWPADQIRDGDVFFTNDPGWGALHCDDAMLAMPIFHSGRLAAWSGVITHAGDVSGLALADSGAAAQAGATAQGGSAGVVPFPAMKVAESFAIRQDAERAIALTGQLPARSALIMRGRVATLTVTHRRIVELIGEHGVDAFVAATDGILGYVQRVLRGRLAEIPDGWWLAQGYVDRDGPAGGIRPVRCRLIKSGEHLVFDLAGTAALASDPAVCARPAMEDAVIGAVLALLCYDLPWAVGAVRDIISIESPAVATGDADGAPQASEAATMSALCTQDVVASAFAKMLMCSRRHRSQVQATWAPGINGGQVFARTISDGLSVSHLPGSAGAGGGARSTGDGMDSAGTCGSAGSGFAGTEAIESHGPVLQVYRREVTDSGGPGRYRGGVSIECAIAAHQAMAPATFRWAASGVAAPAGRGLAGGLPGAAASNLVLRASDLRLRLAAGLTPTDPADVAADGADIPAARLPTELAEHDVVISVLGGGAGYGDPLRRDPAQVAADVTHGRVSPVMARAAYGVVLAGGEPDQPATDAARKEARERRLAQARPVARAANTGAADARAAYAGAANTSAAYTGAADARAADGEVLHPVADALEVVAAQGGPVIRCCVCHRSLGPCDQDYKLATVMRESPLTSASPLNRHCDLGRFVLREFFCPGCATCLVVDVQDRDEPVLEESAFTRNGDRRALSHRR
jgi:N-methylhydantoinase B